MNTMIPPRQAGQAPVVVRAAALALAVLVNLATMAGIQRLATPAQPAQDWVQQHEMGHHG